VWGERGRECGRLRGKACELAGNRHGGDVVGLAACPHPATDAVQPVLGAPRDLQDVVGLACLAVAKRDA
jgi:hypothetical protein